MKKLLTGSTALIAAGLLSGGAYAADPIKIGVGGYFGGGIVFVDQDDSDTQPGANTRGHRIERESEITFAGSTTLDNGIKVGVNIQLEGESSSDIIDESYIWFEGTFGKITFGAEDSAAVALNVGTPKPSNFFWGAASPVFSTVDCGTNGVGIGAGLSCAIGDYGLFGVDGDNEKITYLSPKMGGFQVGISYTPDGHEAGSATGQQGAGYSGGDADNTAGEQSEVISVGAQWSGDLGGMGVRIGGGYKSGDLEVPAAGAEDQDLWGVGVSVSSGKLNVGAHWTEDDRGVSITNSDKTSLVVGLNYKLGGPWQVGAEYTKTEVEAGTAGGEDEGEAFVLGGSYNMGAGVSFQGEVQFWDISDNLGAAAAENDATVFIVGTTIWF
jgi:predicted porin